MKCEDCQRLLLTEDLLEPHEREHMHKHLENCAGCSKFQAEARKFNDLVMLASSAVNQPENASALTDRIMTQVMRPAPQKISASPGWIFNPFTRYALSGASICLIVFFAIEWQSPANATLPKGPVAGLQQVILNSQSFRKELNSKEKRKSLLSSCISPDKKQTDIACLKEKMKSIQF